MQDFRRADGEHRARLGDYEQVHNAREDAAKSSSIGVCMMVLIGPMCWS